MRLLIALTSLLLLVACTHPRLYPVCFYNIRPTAKEANEKYFPPLRGVLQTVIGGTNRVVSVANTPDGRWLVARVTNSENADAAMVWPRIGCIGDALDSDGLKKQMDCVSYVKHFVETSAYFSFGNAKDAGNIDIWSESIDGQTIVRCNHLINEDN